MKELSMNDKELPRLNHLTLQKLEVFSYEGKGVLTLKLIEVFVNNCSDRFKSIDQNLERQDYAQILRAAHNVKSGAQVLGADRLCQICNNIELKCRNNDESVSIEITKLKQEHFLLLLELEKMKLDLST